MILPIVKFRDQKFYHRYNKEAPPEHKDYVHLGHCQQFWTFAWVQGLQRWHRAVCHAIDLVHCTCVYIYALSARSTARMVLTFLSACRPHYYTSSQGA